MPNLRYLEKRIRLKGRRPAKGGASLAKGGELLKEKQIKFKTEENILDERIEKLKSHLSKNKKDYPASRALAKKLWVVNKFEKARA